MKRVFSQTGLPIMIRHIPEGYSNVCMSCGAVEDVLSFSILSGQNEITVLSYCRICTKKIITFLAQAWAETEVQTPLSYKEERQRAIAEISLADVLRLMDMYKLLHVCTHLAEYLSGNNLQGRDMDTVEQALRSLILILSTRGMRLFVVDPEQTK